MATASNFENNQTSETEFYLPGTSISTIYDRVGDKIIAVLGRHGRVLIPSSYNK
ncbi:MAG: hypothetical protein ABEI27_10325 [Halobellus sp.]|uniref:hypothetical protein n=1 Tax=Halobellus sp. TaxID=1979212 RepID=UPI0035D3FB2C